MRRSVAKALTQAGRPVHFTTVARWKKREWQVEPRLEHPLAAVMRKVDVFVPLLTGDPTTKAVDIVGEIVGARAANTQTGAGGGCGRARRGETSSIVEATVNRFLRRDRRNSLGCNFADQ